MSGNIAISWSEFDKFGCVKCGCEYCFSTGVQGGGTSPVKCGQCDEVFIILADGLDKSRIGFGSPAFYPELQKHPRQGRPKHEYIRPDVKPDGGGEYWQPRGVGYDLSGFVKCKQAGERIIEMVKKVINKTPKTWLDYREREPNWIQVKIQAEDGFDLEKLCVLCKDGIITEQKLQDSQT